MSAYTFTPAHPGTVAYAYAGGPMLTAGDVAELTDAQRDRLVGIIPGVDGGPCLVPVAVPVDAAPVAVPKTPGRKKPKSGAA